MSKNVLLRRRGRLTSAGFTLIELLIGLALGVLVAAAATSVFIMNARVREATDSLSRLQEGARVAFELVARDVRQTGGFSCGREAATGDSGSRSDRADYRFSNGLATANAAWWSTWTAPLPTTNARGGFRGYGPSNATPGTGFGTATGNRIAGTVRSGAYAELAWQAYRGAEFALEGRAQSDVAANDANTVFAPGYGMLALRARWQLDLGPGKLELLGRVDNLDDRRVVSSVIVNEGNQRFFEPSPGRTWLVSARWSAAF